MAADASAYFALGLEPGADSAAIERAYKKLIKEYHPDREGGDSKRAAEINRAYRELRSGRMPDPLELADDELVLAERAGWTGIAVVLAGAILALVVVTGPMTRLFGTSSASSTPPGQPRLSAVFNSDAMDRPLNNAAVDEAVRDAVRLSRVQDEMALASSSRDCHRRLRTDPSIAQLDRCAAFDDAVIQLQDRDPLRDRGPFSELAVTGRLMSGATLLSNDYLAIDSRLDRIRLRVELALVPPAPQPLTTPPLPEAEGTGRGD